MTGSWGGAQWVLATLILIEFFLPPLTRASGMRARSGIEFAGFYIGKVIEKAILIGLLAWGGFWT